MVFVELVITTTQKTKTMNNPTKKYRDYPGVPSGAMSGMMTAANKAPNASGNTGNADHTPARVSGGSLSNHANANRAPLDNGATNRHYDEPKNRGSVTKRKNMSKGDSMKPPTRTK